MRGGVVVSASEFDLKVGYSGLASLSCRSFNKRLSAHCLFLPGYINRFFNLITNSSNLNKENHEGDRTWETRS